MPFRSIIIAGTQSGVGKTTVSIGIMAALRARGLVVQPFKVGPDFLDPTYLALASGRTCYNLDGWMTGRPYVEGLFARATRDADFAVIEGVMMRSPHSYAVAVRQPSGTIAVLQDYLERPSEKHRWLKWPVLRGIAGRDRSVVVIDFNRNYGQHSAVFAGFEAARGEVIVTLDADLQNPPEEVPKLLAKIREGYDVVGSVRVKRQDTLFRRVASRLVNRVTTSADHRRTVTREHVAVLVDAWAMHLLEASDLPAARVYREFKRHFDKGTTDGMRRGIECEKFCSSCLFDALGVLER